MYYVAVDIGCIECGEDSAVIGIFTDKTDAKEALGIHERHQAVNWSGQHSFEIFEVSEINKALEVSDE